MSAVPAGYKQTEVGVIPEDWVTRRIATVCTLINGRGFKPFEWKKAGLPIIRIQNLNGADEFNYYQGNYDKKIEVDSGQLLFAWSGSRGTSFGPHVWSGTRGLLNYHTWKMQIHESVINPKFFFHALKKLTEFIEDRAHGAAALVHTQKWEMEGFQFPLPATLTEQRSIAAALSDVDALLAKLDQLIAKKRDLKQAAMQQLLTGKKRLPEFSGAWEVKSFGEVLSRVNGKAFQIQSSDYQDTGDHPVVDQGKEPVIGFSDRADKVFRCPSGGVIVFGDHTCIVKFVDFDFVVGADGTQIMAGKNGQSARFHAYQLEYSGIPTTGYNRHFKFVKEREFITPALPEQTAIAAILSDMDAEIAALETRLEKTRTLKQGMMQQLLTGRIRLV
jgi:type I restriction enzyme S subunit